MPSKHALHVSLTGHLREFIEGLIASGEFSTASEVVRAALRLLEQDTARTAIGTRGGAAAGRGRSAHGDRA